MTGNELDIVYTYKDGKMVIEGLKPWGKDIILLPHPKGLVSTLQNIIKQCEEYDRRTTGI